MLKFPVGPDRHTSFPDTPFLYEDKWSCVELFSPCLPINSLFSRARQMHCKASNETSKN